MRSSEVVIVLFLGRCPVEEQDVPPGDTGNAQSTCLRLIRALRIWAGKEPKGCTLHAIQCTSGKHNEVVLAITQRCEATMAYAVKLESRPRTWKELEAPIPVPHDDFVVS